MSSINFIQRLCNRKNRQNSIFVFLIFLLALVHGFTFAVLSLLIGGQITEFIHYQQQNITGDVTQQETLNSSSFMYRGLIITLIHVVVCFGEQLFSRLPALNVVAKLENKLIYNMLKMPVAVAQTTKTGYITALLHDNLEKILNATTSVSAIVTAISIAIVGYCFAFALNWKIAGWTVYLLPVMLIIRYTSYKYFKTYLTQEQKYFNEANGIVQECLSCIRTVLGLNAQKEISEKYIKQVIPGAQAFYYRTISAAVIEAGQNFIIYSAYAWIFWTGSEVAGDDALSRGYIYAVALIIINAAQMFQGINSHINKIQSAVVGYKSLQPILLYELDKPCAKSATTCDINGQITFDNVSFCYPSRPHDWVLKDLNFSINPGECIVIVGKSGSGKSTLVSLLLGLFEPSYGTIKHDSLPFDSINLQHLRSQLGYVSQEPVLFDCTIKENILMGNPEATESQIFQALTEANADEFIRELPHGLDTSVGECGGKLSGGQKQRIAIARALIRQPKVIIFDEATSALDFKNEKIVLQTLSKVLSMNKTCIIITHRLNLALRADKVIVLDNGEIVEQGNPQELLKECHVFEEMCAARLRKRSKQMADRKISLGTKRKQSSLLSRKRTRLMSFDSAPLEEMEKSKITILRALFGIDKKTMINLGLGFGFSLIDAISFPLTGILMAAALNNFTLETAVMKEGMSKVSLALFLIALISALGFLVTFHFMAIFGRKTAVHLRKTLFSVILGNKQMDYFETEENSSAVLSMRLTADILNVQKILAVQIVNLFSCTISALICWIAAFCISPIFALCCFVVFPLKQVLRFAQAYIKLWNLRRSKTLEEAVSKYVVDMLNNYQTVKVFSLEETLFKKYQELMVLLRKRRVIEAYVGSFVEALQNAMDFVFFVFGFGIGAVFISRGIITPYQMWLVYFLNLRANRKLVYLSQSAADFSHSYFSIGLIFKTHRNALMSSVLTPARRIRHPDLKGHVQFSNVTFSYESRPDQLALNGVTFDIPKNKTVALVGHSGSGKSTVAALLARFYEPDQGAIKINDINISDISIGYLRSKVVKVSQEPVLFDCTIEENIKFGMKQATYREIETAAKIANAHNFIKNLAQGYETRVGERGVQLSGGQKQRIAIARALLREPVVLVLDEPSSALDYDSEKAFQEMLEKHTFTCLLITHRLLTAQRADEILVLSEGSIVENGRHDDLIKSKGHYWKMVMADGNND